METVDSSRVKILENENRRLRIAIEELSALNDIATAITSTQSLENVIDLIVNKCIKHLKVQQAVVMLLNEKDEVNPFHTMIRKQDSVSQLLPYRLDAQLTGWMLKNKSPLVVNDLVNDARFKFFIKSDVGINSLLSVPMLLKGKLIGLLTVFNKHSESGFTNEDQRLLSILAAQSAHIIENTRLYEEEQTLYRLREEMRVAYDIQMKLLPSTFPKIKGYDIAGKSIPAKDVGGDYFDFIEIDENRIAFCLGDISGKGIPAALLMANLQATLRGQALMNISCKQTIDFSNKLLHNSTDFNRYATLFYGILNTNENEIIYCNAGHNVPVLLDYNLNSINLDSGGIVVGALPDYEYQETCLKFDIGNLLVLYSDGITEAMNKNEEEFGEERLQNVVKQNKDAASGDLINIIMSSVNEFAEYSPQMDDMTVVVIKRV